MYFYEVLVATSRYFGNGPLTYASGSKLAKGTIVTVPFAKQKVPAIVAQSVPKPDFAVKEVLWVVDEKPLAQPLLKLHQWMPTYYPGPDGVNTQLFLPSSLATKQSKTADKGQDDRKPAAQKPLLTAEQERTVAAIHGAPGPFLLHGETGTGKTRVYIEIAKEVVQQGRSVIILTPEIGLTPQIAAVFEETFPGNVITVHSTHTSAERRDKWLTIHKSPQPLVVIGPRSALFSPVHDLGLIVIDEAHDTAYKQEQLPYYQTTRVAAQLARFSGAKLVLGTATPLVQDYFTFVSKDLPILRMEHPINKAESRVLIDVVDLKQRDLFTRSAWLSNNLISAIGAALEHRMQSMVFLNRRGTARLILCQRCGWQSLCPRCDVPLTYHGDSHNLRCHTCGLIQPAPSTCEVCQSTEIEFKSIGTKTLVTELNRLFPKARIERFDSDTTKSESLAARYSQIKEGNVDILVGTQVLSKGLDLPKLTVVGIVAADTGLYFPDYSAEERTFQTLRQVIGRAGRGTHDGRVIIQTYQPERSGIQAAVRKDYQSFYQLQLKERELYRFPPYYFTLKVSVQRASQASARSAAQDIAASVGESGLAIQLSGPAPAFVEKIRNKYRWQLIVKSKQRSELIKVIELLPKSSIFNIDPTDLL